MSENETVDTLRTQLADAERSRYETQVARVRAMDPAELADLVDLHCADVRSGHGCDDCGTDCWHQIAVTRWRAVRMLTEAARPGGNPFVTPELVRDAGVEVPAGVRVGTWSYSSRPAADLRPGDLLGDVLPGMTRTGGYVQVVHVAVAADGSTSVTTRRTNADEPVRSWSYPPGVDVHLYRALGT